MRLERYIAFLKGGVGGPSRLMMAHRNRGMGLPLEVVISVKQTGSRHAGTGGSIAVSAVFATPSAGSAVTLTTFTSKSTPLPPTPAPPEI